MVGVETEMESYGADEAAGEDLGGEDLEAALFQRIELANGDAYGCSQLLAADVPQFAFPAKFLPELPGGFSRQLQVPLS